MTLIRRWSKSRMPPHEIALMRARSRARAARARVRPVRAATQPDLSRLPLERRKYSATVHGDGSAVITYEEQPEESAAPAPPSPPLTPPLAPNPPAKADPWERLR